MADDVGDPFGLSGTLLDRRYRVDRAVAEGGFGVVYAGYHLALHVPIAVKVLKPPADVDADEWIDRLAQFVEEARTLARLRHPSVVQILDSGTSHLPGFDVDIPWMVLEWLDGETLRANLSARRGRGGRTPRECLDLLRPVIEAVAAAHEAGIVHRDLKPSNIMLATTPNGVVPRVVDFGIAKIMGGEDEPAKTTGDTHTASTVTAFSLACAAPEQLSHTRTGPWTDVYALGLIVTEVLTDAAPIPLDDAHEHYRGVFDPVRPTPQKLGVDVGAWEAVLVRAVAVRPSERHASAAELLADLERTVDEATHSTLSTREGAAHTTGTTRSTIVARSLPPPTRTGTTRVARRMTYGVAIAAVAAIGVAATTFRASKKDAPAPAVAEAAAAVGCTSNRECTHANETPSVCRRDSGACVALGSTDCIAVADPRDIDRDDTIWIGTMFPKTGSGAAEYGTINDHAVDLGRRDFAQVAAGLGRGFGIVSCDDAADARRAATHLVDVVGVPAVIGFKSSVEAIDLATSIFVPKGVLAIASINSNPLVTTVPQPPGGPRLVWRTTYSTADSEPAIAHLVSDALEPELRAKGEVARGKKVRVLVLRPKDAAGLVFANGLVAELRFNGLTAMENGDAYRDVAYEGDAPEGSPVLAAAAKEILAFRPNVIVYMGGNNLVRSVMAPVEDQWPRGERAKPRWVSTAHIAPTLAEVIGKSDERRRRQLGMTIDAQTLANARLVMRYKEVFDENVTRTISPNSAYDAFYLVAYASYAIPVGEPVSGAKLARGLERLQPPGKPLEVGIQGIFDAYSTLSAGGTIDFTGATGKLDFNLATGESQFDYTILCAAGDEHAADGAPSGLVYSATTRSMTGAMKCP